MSKPNPISLSAVSGNRSFSALHPDENTTWQRELIRRLGVLWWLKAVGTATFFTIFFIGYFHLLRHPVSPVTIMPVTEIDRMIDFQPSAFVLYLSLWIYTSLVPALQPNFRTLAYYGVAVGSLCLAGMACFYFFPTATPPTGIDWSQYPMLAILQRIDASGNACPSMHVAGAIFSGMWLHRQLAEINVPVFLRYVNWLWCAGIVYSALATKQHLIWDAVAGLILAVILALLTLPRKTTPTAPAPH